jgi:nitrate/TMAO reductase-like tetraheme cytochrome c subunit
MDEEHPLGFWRSIGRFGWTRRLLIAACCVSLIVGVGVMAAYNTVADYTASNAFCANACHEMNKTVYAEYSKTQHFRNEHGVVVTCADCHMPHNNWAGGMITHVEAVTQVWGHFVNNESNLKVFDAHRPELEKRVWAEFAASNASTCKSCHAYGNMVLTGQNPAAAAMHAQAMKTNANCLDCHKGVAHAIIVPASAGVLAAAPVASDAAGQAVYAKSCAGCHAAMAPKLGDTAAWRPLLAQGRAALVEATIHGKGIMPARGGDASLSDDAIGSAVDYMMNKSR